VASIKTRSQIYLSFETSLPRRICVVPTRQLRRFNGMSDPHPLEWLMENIKKLPQ